MSVERPAIYAMNRGLVSRFGLARTDLKRLALSASLLTNWMPRLLGSMMLRPGLGYIDSTKSNNQAIHIPFVFSNTDTAIIELTDSVMRVRVSEIAISRPSVSTTVSNGNFDTDLSGWTDNDEVGATSVWSGGCMRLTGDGTAYAIRTQQVTVSGADKDKEHALRIVIERGPVVLRVGSSSGADDYVSEASLETGTHSLSFTPTGDFYVQFKANLVRFVQVESCTIESAGAMEIPTPWSTADLSNIRWDQSADVVFIACDGFQQRRIERRATRSWSLVLYKAEDGPFRIQNLTTTTITPSAITGNITLTASKPLFRSSHVGGIFQLVSTGQTVSKDISSENTFSDTIRVTGVGSDRTFTINLAGPWAGTVTLQRSIDSSSGPFSDVSGESWSINTTTTFGDGLNNQEVWYRIGIKTGNYTSGTATVSLTIAIGSITGAARITDYSSPTSVSAEVVASLGGTSATEDWSEGEWSNHRGWPTAVALYEGRLWWAGRGKIWGSVSDAFASFNANTEGDSGPISRSLGSGPVDAISWLLPLQRLLAGGGMAEISIRSTSLDEPLTPSNYNAKNASTQGTYNIPAVTVDTNGIFLQKSRLRIYQSSYDPIRNDYTASDLTKFVPDIAQKAGGFSRLAVQRKPDTRIHGVLADGTVAILVFDPAEEELCWVTFETDGEVEDVVVIPGVQEDSVYYCIKRTVGGFDKRYIEKWALESECVGATLNKQADSFVAFANSPAAPSVPAGTAVHLAGKSAVVWADGKCLTDSDGNIATFTVEADGGISSLTNGGEIYNAATGIIGLPYTAQFRSTKLAYAVQMGSSLTQRKKVHQIGFILADTHHKGLKFGRDFDHLYDLPQMVGAKPVSVDTIHEDYDHDMTAFGGAWDTDSRVCLQGQAPRPCTVLAAVMAIEGADRV